MQPPQDIPRIDDEIAREPEDIRRDLAEAASRDLFMFCTGVLQYRDLTQACHGPLCTWHDKNQARFKETLEPRGHLKSSVITIGKNLQKVTQNPENRILLGNETATNAERFLGAIKAHAETNRRFRGLYSHLIPPDNSRKHSWSQTELTFKRQGVYTVPTIDTIGMTGAMTSRHYTHLCIDDPISAEAAESKMVMDTTIRRISNLISLMDDPGKDTVDLVGTRWAFYDVYSWFEETFSPARYIRSDTEDGVPIWPERFSLETLAQIRKSLGEYLYSCQYRNNPRNADVQDFNIQDLKFWRWSADEESIVLFDRNGEVERVVEVDDLDITTTVDPAYNEGLLNLSRLDRNAVVTCGIAAGVGNATADAIVLDAWGKRCTPLELIEHLVWTLRRFHPRAFGIQKAGYEMVLKYFLAATAEQEGLYAHVIPVKPGGKGKKHIRSLQPVAATGHLYISPSHHMLRDELADYPLGQHDDVADALGLQPQIWHGVMSEARWEKYKESESKILRAIRSQGSGKMDVTRFTPSQLEDAGYDPEAGRYGSINEVSM